uniref:MFS domain-containing protein n=1 Tax=Angiostrongylus cantonensis TaxID=6313 RepID=A0A158P6G8_ANGCA
MYVFKAIEIDFTSLLFEWDEACQNSVITAVMSTSLMVGALIGSFLAGWLADAYGRLPVLKGGQKLLQVSGLSEDAVSAAIGSHCDTFKVTNLVLLVECLDRPRSRLLAVSLNGWSISVVTFFSIYARFFWLIKIKDLMRYFFHLLYFLTLASLRHSSVCIPLLALCYCFISSSLVSFGFYFNADALPGNRYVNMILMGASKFVMGLLPFAVSSWVGRRPIMLFSLVIAILLVVSAALDPAWKINHLYSAELFPTVVRNMARAICNVGSRFGSVAAPMVSLLFESILLLCV